jgi:hypothetical protein
MLEQEFHTFLKYADGFIVYGTDFRRPNASNMMILSKTKVNCEFSPVILAMKIEDNVSSGFSDAINSILGKCAKMSNVLILSVSMIDIF